VRYVVFSNVLVSILKIAPSRRFPVVNSFEVDDLLYTWRTTFGRLVISDRDERHTSRRNFKRGLSYIGQKEQAPRITFGRLPNWKLF
jgi:hypothetical protein